MARTLALQPPPAAVRRAAWMIPAACGVLVGVAAFDAVPVAVGSIGAWAAAWAAAGLGLMVLSARMARTGSVRSTASMATVGIAFHSILEGVTAGTGVNLGLGGAALVAVGLVMHLVPEGVALFGLLTEAGLSARRALARCAMTWGLVAAGFAGARWFLSDVPVGPLGAAMGLAAGSFIFLARALWRQRSPGSGAWLAAAAGLLWVAALHLG